MRGNALLLLLPLLILGGRVGAADDEFPAFDPTPWLGRSTPSFASQLDSYRELCRRRISHAIGKLTPDFRRNGELTDAVCACTADDFRRKRDLQYLRVVNLDLRGGRAGLPPMPPELSLYLNTYQEVELACAQKIAAAQAVKPAAAGAARKAAKPPRLPSSKTRSSTR